MTRAAAVAPVVLFLSAFAPAAQAQYLEPPPPMQPAPPGYPGQAAPSPYPGQAAPSPYPAGATPGAPAATPPSDDESQDSGLGLEWVWLNAEAGASFADLQSLSSSNLGLQKTHAAGPAFGVGAGVRLLFFTLGVRARDLLLSDIGSLWMLNAEAAFHIRIWRIDPYFGVRGGYDFVGSLNSSTVQVATGNTPSDVAVHGFNVGPMVGIDVYLAKWLSLGGDLDAQFLFLHRPPLALPAGVDASMLPRQEQVLYQNSGSSVGFGSTLAAHLGIHF